MEYLGGLVNILQFFVVLSILILVHELGHFWTAKKFGIWVEEFGFGIPPRAWGKKIGETIYSLNWLPFGGFVRLHGESDDDAISKPDRAFMNKSVKVRSAIVVAGVVMNFMLALFAFAISYSITGIPRETGIVKVIDTAPGSPANEAGIRSEDIIVSINGQEVKSSDEFITAVDSLSGENTFVINSNGEEKELVMTPREAPPEGEGALGVVISSSDVFFPPWWQRPFYGVYYGFLESVLWAQTVFGGFIYIFSSLFSGQVPEGLAGPVGIYAITTVVAESGFVQLINFVGILSINLAILNIIPFPALDGGRLLFIVLEGIFGKRVLPKIEGYIHMAGMGILILALIAITAGDISKLIQAGSIAGFIESFTP